MTNSESDKARTRFRTSQEYRELEKEKDLFRRRILFIAIFSKRLGRDGVDVILVGGEAIDLYTSGTFSTSDIDLLVSDKTTAGRLLNKFAFRKEANGLWFNRQLNIVIQVISESYSGDKTRVRKFRIRESELAVAAPEDLIANRLYSAKFWKSNPQRDLEQAVALLKIFDNSIDDAYLNELAGKNKIGDYLADARKQASKI